MNIIDRLEELENMGAIAPPEYGKDLSEEELLEYRTLRCIRNVFVSNTGSSFITVDVMQNIIDKLGWKWKRTYTILENK